MQNDSSLDTGLTNDELASQKMNTPLGRDDENNDAQTVVNSQQQGQTVNGRDDKGEDDLIEQDTDIDESEEDEEEDELAEDDFEVDKDDEEVAAGEAGDDGDHIDTPKMKAL